MTNGTIVLAVFVAVLWLAKASRTSSPSPVFDHDLKQKAVSRLILSKLGMTKPPIVTLEQIASVDETVLQAYSRLAEIASSEATTVKASKQVENEKEYYAKTVTIIDVTEWTSSLLCVGRILSKLYQLDVTRIPSAFTEIRRATLQLYYNDDSILTANDLLLSAYQLTESCSRTDRILLDVKQLSPRLPASFIQFDVTAAVRSWATDVSTYHGLEVEISMGTCSLSSFLQTPFLYTTFLQLVDVTVTPERGPSLFVTSQAIKAQARNRRQTLDLSYCSTLQPGHPNCCIYDYKLNFVEDLGWNWIVQPSTIQLNQCSGDCPSTWAEEGNYTQVINEYKMLNPSGSVAPCCNPRTYNDLEILYFDENATLLTGILTDMIVTSCVCS